MPFAGFKNFKDCVRKTKKKKGFGEKRASRYCGAIKHKVEGNKKKHIIVNWRSIKSIKSSERKKSKLENQGYNLIKTKPMGFDKVRLTYSRNPV